MFYHKLQLDVNGANDRKYNFSCAPDAPLGEVLDALNTMRAHVISQINASAQPEENHEEKECGAEENCQGDA